MNVYIHACKYTYICMPIYMPICAQTCKYIKHEIYYKYMYKHIYIYIYRNMHVNICVYVYMCVCVCDYVLQNIYKYDYHY